VVDLTVLRESRFTNPRDECPTPGYWTSTDGDSTEREVTALIAAMVVALQPEFVVETGTAFGQTTEAIGGALEANRHGRLVSLETDPERVASSRKRCDGLPVEIRLESSLDYAPEHPIDFAWFDSLFYLRPLEFRRFLPWMHDRTVVGFHDTGSHHPVRGLLRPLEDEGLIAPMYLPTPRGACFARVTRR
jgi:predicted O-methyltransferase YrrM